MFSHKLPPPEDPSDGFFGSVPNPGKQDASGSQVSASPFRSSFDESEELSGFNHASQGKGKSTWKFTWHSLTGISCVLLAVAIVGLMIVLPLNGMHLADGASSLLGAGGTVLTGVFAWIAVGIVGLIATGIGLFFVPARKTAAIVLVVALIATVFSMVSIQNAMRSVVFRAQQDVQEKVLAHFDVSNLTDDGKEHIVRELEALNLDDKGLDVISEQDWESMPTEIRTRLENELRARAE
ncbi:MAG: hypothetical protein ACTHWM_05360 [Yaniella sp.]|uniref:hypothetical protein n=1 Tax=Yaniella sp. TaxID=2773929 RepID=UPI003F98AD2C